MGFKSRPESMSNILLKKHTQSSVSTCRCVRFRVFVLEAKTKIVIVPMAVVHHGLISNIVLRSNCYAQAIGCFWAIGYFVFAYVDVMMNHDDFFSLKCKVCRCVTIASLVQHQGRS